MIWTIWVVFCKEAVENLRDRRSVFSALLFGPLFGPVLFVALIILMTEIETERSEQRLVLPIVGSEHAPNLVHYLEQQGVVAEPAPSDPEASVRAHEEDLVLIIPKSFGDQFKQARAATVTLVLDRSRQATMTKVKRISTLLERYGAQIGALRLQARGIDPGVVRAIYIDQRDLSTAESRSATVLAMLPYFVMMALFIGGMYLAIDTTAGERERGSIEALLITPPTRWALMTGKLCATTAFALLSLALTLLMFSLSAPFIPTENLGIEIALGWDKCVLLFLITAPIALLAAATQTIIAAFSRGFREAQTYISLLVFIPLLPSLMQMLVPVKPELWMFAIPIFSQNLLIEQTLRNESLETTGIVLALITTAGLGLGLAWIAARLYRREQLLYSS